MFYHFGIILVLAAANTANAADRPKLSRTRISEFPRPWTKYATPPLSKPVNKETDSLTPATVWVEPIDDEEPNGSGESIIIGYKPIYGTIYSNLGDVPLLPEGFVCPRRYAFQRYARSCDIYIECKNFQPTLKVCPDGMHVKNNLRWSEYPCAYPPEAQCAFREEALPARPTAECPHQFGSYPITNELRYSKYQRCSSYISCSAGVAHVMNCTFGLVFNPVMNLCDWPEKVPGCQDVFDFRCPVPHFGEEDMVINYRYPNDSECRYFYSCLNGGYRVLACDEGLLFDYRIGRCVEYDDFICNFDYENSKYIENESYFMV